MSGDLRILILEDQPADAELMLREVRQAGIECTALRVETEQDFRKQLQEFRPALVLADYRLPAWDGKSALAVVQKECPDVPFIFVSGVLGEETAVESILQGATDYIVKERLTRLGAAVRRALLEVERRNDLRRAEQQLRDSERRYRRLFESAGDGLLVLDAETGMVVDVNPFLCQMLGSSHGQLLEKKIWELRCFRDIAANHAGFLELRRQNYLRREDAALETSDGRRLDVEFVSNAYLENDRKVIQCNFRDITERLRAETVLRLESAALAAAANAIVITDRDGVIEWANAAFATFTGYRIDEAVGRRPGELLKSGKHDQSFYREMWATILSGKVWHGELFNRRKDDSLYSEEMTITPLKNERGEIEHFIAVKQDITQRKVLEEQFLQAQKMESVGRLAGGVAHDFNNMLTVIHGRAELAMLQMDPAQPFHAHLLEIEEAARRSANLTRQLLAFASRQTVAPKVLDLNENVTDSLRMLRRLIGENVQLAWQPAPNLWPIKMDPSQLDQVLANLCVNARDAIADVGTMVIATANRVLDAAFCATNADAVPGDYVQLTVRDSGCGMDTATVAQIFDPFFTTKASGKGTGLGLSTVYGAIRQNGGYIAVSSAQGQGTTFEIYLPRHVGPPEPYQTPSVAARVLHGHETILLVEDEPVVLNLTREMLETQGYAVLGASSPTAAIRLAEEHAGEIDLLLTDVVMPEMNGRDLAKKLVSQDPHLKCLFMSGHAAGVFDEHWVFDAGTPFIEKPFLLAALGVAVREALDSNGSRGQPPA